MRYLLSCIYAAVFLFGSAAYSQEEFWKPLFNGVDITDWEIVGAGFWTVENGEIVARRDFGNPSGGWLVTKKDYGNFRLRFKFRMMIEGANSGILLRDPGHAKIGRPAFNGFEMQIYEADDTAKNPTGSIYDVSRAYFKKMKRDVWTDFEIHCIGDHIITFMNGEKMAETHSRRSFKGAIGLQLHGGKEPADIRWKEIEILELPDSPVIGQSMEEKAEQAAGDYFDLLNGKTIDNDFQFYWESGAAWTLHNGMLRGEHPEQISWIFLKEVFTDFIMSFDVRISKGGNAGVCFRLPWNEGGDTKAGPAFVGYECQILDTGYIGEKNLAGSLYNLAPAYPSDLNGKAIFRAGSWNRYKMYVVGDHIIIYVNDIKTAECHSDRSRSGRIGFQVHHPAVWVEYRNVQLKRIR